MGPLGALCGGPVSGVIADRLGRKVALVLMGLPYFCGFLTLTYAHFITDPLAFKIVLMVGRFFTGAGLGWSSITSPVSNHKCLGRCEKPSYFFITMP